MEEEVKGRIKEREGEERQKVELKKDKKLNNKNWACQKTRIRKKWPKRQKDMQKMRERWSCRLREGEVKEQKEKVAWQYTKNTFQEN